MAVGAEPNAASLVEQTKQEANTIDRQSHGRSSPKNAPSSTNPPQSGWFWGDHHHHHHACLGDDSSVNDFHLVLSCDSIQFLQEFQQPFQNAKQLPNLVLQFGMKMAYGFDRLGHCGKDSDDDKKSPAAGSASGSVTTHGTTPPTVMHPQTSSSNTVGEAMAARSSTSTCFTTSPLEENQEPQEGEDNEPSLASLAYSRVSQETAQVLQDASHLCSSIYTGTVQRLECRPTTTTHTTETPVTSSSSKHDPTSTTKPNSIGQQEGDLPTKTNDTPRQVVVEPMDEGGSSCSFGSTALYSLIRRHQSTTHHHEQSYLMSFSNSILASYPTRASQSLVQDDIVEHNHYYSTTTTTTTCSTVPNNTTTTIPVREASYPKPMGFSCGFTLPTDHEKIHEEASPPAPCEPVQADGTKVLLMKVPSNNVEICLEQDSAPPKEESRVKIDENVVDTSDHDKDKDKSTSQHVPRMSSSPPFMTKPLSYDNSAKICSRSSSARPANSRNNGEPVVVHDDTPLETESFFSCQSDPGSSSGGTTTTSSSDVFSSVLSSVPDMPSQDARPPSDSELVASTKTQLLLANLKLGPAMREFYGKRINNEQQQQPQAIFPSNDDVELVLYKDGTETRVGLRPRTSTETKDMIKNNSNKKKKHRIRHSTMDRSSLRVQRRQALNLKQSASDASGQSFVELLRQSTDSIDRIVQKLGHAHETDKDKQQQHKEEKGDESSQTLSTQSTHDGTCSSSSDNDSEDDEEQEYYDAISDAPVSYKHRALESNPRSPLDRFLSFARAPRS